MGTIFVRGSLIKNKQEIQGIKLSGKKYVYGFLIKNSSSIESEHIFLLRNVWLFFQLMQNL